MQTQSFGSVNGLEYNRLGSFSPSSCEVQPLLESALSAYVQAVETVKYFFFGYVCPLITTLLFDRDIKAVEPVAPFISQVETPVETETASQQAAQKSLISTSAQAFTSSEYSEIEAKEESLSEVPDSCLAIDDGTANNNQGDEVGFQNPEMAIRPGSPGFQKLIGSYIPEMEEQASSPAEKEVPPITVTDECTDTADTGAVTVTEQPEAEKVQPPSLELSMTPKQSLATVSAALFDALPEKVRKSLRGQEVMPQEEKSDDGELRAMQMAEKSLRTFGANVNRGIQDLYTDLFQFGNTIESEDLMIPKAAFTKKSGAELSQITERHEDVKLAWEAFKDAAVNVLEYVDTCTDNPFGYSKLKRRVEKAEDLQADALKWGSDFSRLATEHKKLRPLLRHTIGRHAVKKVRKYRGYKDSKVTPMTDLLDKAVQEWLDNSPYWQRVLANFSVFERIMKEKVPGFEISNAAVIAQLMVWIRGRLLDRAKEGTLPPMRARGIKSKLKSVFTATKKNLL